MGVYVQSKDICIVLLVWNKGSGKVEVLLYLELIGEQVVGVCWYFGCNLLDVVFGLFFGDLLGLFCNSSSGISISGLVSYCMLVSLGDEDDLNSCCFSGIVVLNWGNSCLGIIVGIGCEILFVWLLGLNKMFLLCVEQNDLIVFVQKNIGCEGFVFIVGIYVKVCLVLLVDVLLVIVDCWDSKSLSIGVGYGNFIGSIIGCVVDVLGKFGKWEGLGIGLIWCILWFGQLIVGVENVISRGKNLFFLCNESNDDGIVLYVCYEQDF